MSQTKDDKGERIKIEYGVGFFFSFLVYCAKVGDTYVYGVGCERTLYPKGNHRGNDKGKRSVRERITRPKGKHE
jgi:hypothetical protein